MRTWVRRPEDLLQEDNDVIVWVKADDGLFYVLLASGVLKLAEGMTHDWEPCERSFLEFGSAK